MSQLSSSDVIKLAQLARLDISEQDQQELSRQLTESLEYVQNLEDIDTSTVPSNYFTTSAKNVMDEDEVDESVMLSTEEVFKNASNRKGNYFIVKRIL